MNRLTTVVALSLMTLSPGLAHAAGWTVDSSQSRVSFVTVKADTIAESNIFKQVSGTVSEDGSARVTIPLDSVETRADTRNQRMREFLFETMKFPDAVITAKLNMADLRMLKVGDRKEMTLKANVSMHGHDLDIEPDVFVTRIGPRAVTVETTEPIVVEAFDFDMEQGLAKLKDLAGLPSITPAVSVSFSLLFTEN